MRSWDVAGALIWTTTAAREGANKVLTRHATHADG